VSCNCCGCQDPTSLPAGAALNPLAAGAAAAAATAIPGMAPTPGMTPPGGKTSKPDLRSRFRLGGGDSERDLSLSFRLLCLSLLLDLLRLSRLHKTAMTYINNTMHFYTTKSKSDNGKLSDVLLPASSIPSSTCVPPVQLGDLQIIPRSAQFSV